MKKKKAIITLLVTILSIALIILVCIYFLDNTGKVNQGNFRINDAVLESYITVEETQEDNVTELSNIVMNITQENKLSLLIANNSNISSMYIDNISTTAPEKLGELKIKQEGKEDCIDCFNKEGKYDLNLQEKDEQYFVELKITNNNCLQNVNVPSETKVIKYDGTVLPCPAFKEYDIEKLNKIGIKTPNIYTDLESIDICNGTRKKPLCKQLYGFNSKLK